MRNHVSSCSATEVANTSSVQIPRMFHHPVKALIHVTSKRSIQESCPSRFLSCVNRVETGSRMVPVRQDFIGFQVRHGQLRKNQSLSWLGGHKEVRIRSFAAVIRCVSSYSSDSYSAEGAIALGLLTLAAQDQYPTGENKRWQVAVQHHLPAETLGAYRRMAEF